jgi:Rad3-related DNA helicase
LPAAPHDLAVNGSVGCRLLVVTLDEWADHVLSESYKLAAIDDLRKYIQANRRLPGMPSAQEVTEKGVNVGEMQAKLLEKVEELTLYMIQLKNENDQLKARLEKLEE